MMLSTRIQRQNYEGSSLFRYLEYSLTFLSKTKWLPPFLEISIYCGLQSRQVIKQILCLKASGVSLPSFIGAHTFTTHKFFFAHDFLTHKKFAFFISHIQFRHKKCNPFDYSSFLWDTRHKYMIIHQKEKVEGGKKTLGMIKDFFLSKDTTI